MTIPIQQTLLDTHVAKLSESVDILLSACAQGNNIATDANMALMKRCSDSILQQYSEVTKSIFLNMQHDDPKALEAIAINKTKAERIALANKAIQDREALKIELTKKLRVLRKSVPDKVRHQMQSSTIQ